MASSSSRYIGVGQCTLRSLRRRVGLGTLLSRATTNGTKVRSAVLPCSKGSGANYSVNFLYAEIAAAVLATVESTHRPFFLSYFSRPFFQYFMPRRSSLILLLGKRRHFYPDQPQQLCTAYLRKISSSSLRPCEYSGGCTGRAEEANVSWLTSWRRTRSGGPTAYLTASVVTTERPISQVAVPCLTMSTAAASSAFPHSGVPTFFFFSSLSLPLRAQPSLNRPFPGHVLFFLPLLMALRLLRTAVVLLRFMCVVDPVPLTSATYVHQEGAATNVFLVDKHQGRVFRDEEPQPAHSSVLRLLVSPASSRSNQMIAETVVLLEDR